MTLLQAEGLVKHFPARDGKGTVKAVDGVSLTVEAGETLGIVGESGSGKSTLGRLLLRLIEPSAGRLHFKGEDLLALDKRAMQARRRDMQIVFQDPYASLDPRMAVGDSIREPLDIHRLGSPAERMAKVAELLQLVGLEESAAQLYPHEFSGGQRQRIGIARAIALAPKLVVLDEPVSALDVSIQSQILNLLLDLRQKLNLSLVFISHDLSVIEHMCDRVAVMYLGRLAEVAPVDTLYQAPRHPYTRALITAIPDIERSTIRERRLLIGEPPNPEAPPSGCAFHPRCPEAMPVCSASYPDETVVPAAGGIHTVRCHLY